MILSYYSNETKCLEAKARALLSPLQSKSVHPQNEGKILKADLDV